MTIPEIMAKLEYGTDLTGSDIKEIMGQMLSGNLSDSQNVRFLSGMASKGETDEELLAMLEHMQKLATRVSIDTDSAIDMCGTGGDGLHTINVSTAASFVVAAAGGIVAKHGNRSSSGLSGSADIFEQLGYDLNREPHTIAEILKRHGIAFMFAPRFHPAMRHVVAARKMLSSRSIFNILGPLSNPASVKNQLVGVSSDELLYRLPRILGQRGARNVIAVRSADGMDEFSTGSSNGTCMLRDGSVTTETIRPESLGLHLSELSDIQIRSKKEGMESFVAVLNGTANRAMTETVALNAAAGLIVGGIAENIGEGVEMALDSIRTGKTYRTLERFVADTGKPEILREAVS